MNIFEALEKGKGKALYRGMNSLTVSFDPMANQCYWNNSKDAYVLFEDLKRNDWTPYVPSEERKIEGMVGFKDPWGEYSRTVNEWRKMGYRDDYIEKFVVKPNVPRETPCVCENIQSGGRVEVDFNQKCIKCGKQFNFVLVKTKTKHKEVFENVKWLKNLTMNIVYPSRDTEQWTKLEKFISMPPVKMTLEWEE